MIHNRTDFYFSDNTITWSSSLMPRLIAVIDAWLSCPVKIYREGFEIMMALSRCRGINNQYVSMATRQIERYLKTIMKHNSALERSWHRDPTNPQPGPVLVAEFHQPTLDEDGVPATVTGSFAAGSSSTVTTPSTDEGILVLVSLHYQQMHAALSADPRAHAEDIARAASLSLIEPGKSTESAPEEVGTEARQDTDESTITTDECNQTLPIMGEMSEGQRGYTRRRRRNK